MTKSLEEAMNSIVAKMDEPHEQDTSQQTSPDAIQDVYVLIVREQEDDAEEHAPVVDSTPAIPTQPAPVTAQQDSFLSVYAFVCFSLALIASTIAFQLYCINNPPVVTITIIPKSQTVTLSGTVQLGRLIRPITIGESQTVPTTGRGHQDAKQASGTVTFYNGLFTQQTVAQGSVYTGQDGVAVITTQYAIIPPGDPSTGYGTATVTAQSLQAGSSGNIQAGDISITINNGLLVRNNQFYNGQDARTYTTVTQHDIYTLSTVLKTTLAQSITGALHGQLKSNEQLQVFPCIPTVTSNHQPGDEAKTVTVSVSQACSAVAYYSEELETKATTFLATQARKKSGAGYSLFGIVRVNVTNATTTHTAPPLVFLSFQASGTWVYALSQPAQERIKHLIAGRTTQEAARLVASLPGVEHVAIRLTGIGDAVRLPKTIEYIHFILIVM